MLQSDSVWDTRAENSYFHYRPKDIQFTVKLCDKCGSTDRSTFAAPWRIYSQHLTSSEKNPFLILSSETRQQNLHCQKESFVARTNFLKHANISMRVIFTLGLQTQLCSAFGSVIMCVEIQVTREVQSHRLPLTAWSCSPKHPLSCTRQKHDQSTCCMTYFTYSH